MSKLPHGWVECELKDFASVKGGKRLPAGAKYSEDETKFPYIRVTNFNNMSVNLNDIKYLTPEIQQKIKNYTISKNDVYISIAGSIGKVGTIPEILDGANLTENAAKIVHNIDKNFLKYTLNTNEVQHQISFSTKSTTQPKLALYRIESLKIKLPPLNEQKRIVERIEKEFEKINEGIEKLKSAQELIKQYRQSLLTKYYNYDSPKLCNLGSCFEIINGDRGKNYPAKSKLHKTGIPFVSAINIMNGFLREDNLCCLTAEQYNLLGNGKINCGDTLLCIRGSIGKHCRYYKDKGAIASSMVIIRKALKEEQNQYLHYYLDSSLFSNEIKKYDNGTAQPNLSAADLRKFIFPNINVNEQKQIVEEIEKRFVVADEVERIISDNLEKAEQLKQSILKKAFEGRLVPQNPTDEPASELLAKIQAERKE